MAKTPSGLRKQQKVKPAKKPSAKPWGRIGVKGARPMVMERLPEYKDPEPSAPDPAILRAHNIARARDVVVIDSRITQLRELHSPLKNVSGEEFCAAGCKGWPCATRKILGES